eukprot:5656209-Amphidinium_carterae.1
MITVRPVMHLIFVPSTVVQRYPSRIPHPPSKKASLPRTTASSFFKGLPRGQQILSDGCGRSSGN